MNDRAQALKALDSANRVRLCIAHIKAQLKAQPSRQDAGDQLRIFLTCGPNDLESARILSLIEACHGIGESRTRRIARQLCLGPKTQVRDLTIKRREEIADAVANRNGAS